MRWPTIGGHWRLWVHLSYVVGRPYFSPSTKYKSPTVQWNPYT